MRNFYEINPAYNQAIQAELDEFACWNFMDESVLTVKSFVRDFFLMYSSK